MHLKYLQKCPICKSEQTKDFLNLGDLYSQGAFLTTEVTYAPQRKIPNILARCLPEQNENGCGAVFSRTVVPPEILYANYFYQSSVSKSMCQWLKKIVDDVSTVVSPSQVLDIGANDFTLLGYYSGAVKKVAIDPSDIAKKASVKDQSVTFINDIFPKGMYSWSSSNKFDIITSIACFYDAADPVLFAKAIAKILNHKGVWVFEVAYLPTMMKDLSYGQIVPEHIFHYTLSVIEHVLKMANLKLIRATKTETNSGSLLCYAAHEMAEGPSLGAYYQDEITKLRREEFDLELDTPRPYEKFRNDIFNHLKNIRETVQSLKSMGYKIYLYGCSTKINTMIQAAGIEDCFYKGIERSIEKVGGKTLWGLPIISEVEAREEANKKTVWFIGPYHFREEILNRETNILDKGVRFIFPSNPVEVYPN